MSEPITIVAIAKGLTPAVLGAVLGALTNRNRSVVEHFAAILAGMSMGYYGVGALAEYMEWAPGFKVNGAMFVTGLFAMNIVYAVTENIAPAIAGIRVKLTGGKQ
jgi:hypothetical protein